MSVVISSSLVLSAPAAPLGPNNPLIGWRNIVTIGNVAADTEDVDYPATNLANPSTIEEWRAADTTEQYITITTGEVDPIDYIAIARHNLASAAIAVSIEGRASVLDPFTELVQPVVLPNDGPALFRFEPQSLAELRIRLQSGSAPARAAVVYAGKLLILQRRIYVGHTPLPYGRVTDVVNGRSEAGDFVGRIVLSEHTETAVDLQNITPAFYRSEMDPFIAAAVEEPFFFAWRPQSYPNEVGYAWLTNDPRPANQRSNGMMQTQLQLGGIVT